MKGIIGLFLISILLSILRHSNAMCKRQFKTLSYRLPNTLFPDFYQIFIITNLGDLNENFTFTGRVTIKMKCLQNTDTIILHAKNLEIGTSDVRVWAGKPFICEADGSCGSDYPNPYNIIPIHEQCFITEYDFYIITLYQYLRAGYYYYVNIPYQGELTTDLAGYYRSSYKDECGSKRWLAATQFESTDARRALPCFDEPIFKARFQVILGHKDTRNAISNMPLRASRCLREIHNWVWDEFDITPPMSVYLLAFLVFDNSFIRAKKCGIVSIYSRSGARDQVDYVCEIAPKILDYFENYFGIRYVLPELQLVAVPDFNSAGMENWGLITFRESALLYDPRVSTRSSQFYVASVVAHEIAHQWFGNLVTMKWWTDLWLNEGFATYISGFGHHVINDVNFLEEEIVDNALSVFSFDSSLTSHPISMPIGNPSEIAQIFDTISYKKGSFALRMLHSLLGEECFRRGLSRYLQKYAYSNAGQDDLWETLTEEAHLCGALSPYITIKQIMDSWTLQTGYPVLTFRRDYRTKIGYITQERFLICPEYLQRCEKFRSLWYIPLSMTHTSESDFFTTVPSTWLATRVDDIVVNLPDNEWVIFNIGMSAIYRVNYDVHNWNLLTNALLQDHNRIGMLNRVQLIDDAFNLAKGRRITYHVALNIIQYLKYECEYFPWKAALRNLAFVEKILRFQPSYDYLKELITSLIAHIYGKISPIIYADTSENLYRVKLQELIMNWACKYEIGDCKQRAMSWFYSWMSSSLFTNQNPIPKNIRSQVYCTAIRAGGEREWNFLWMKYLHSNVGDEKNLILMSLTCTRDIRLLYRFISWSLCEGYGIRKQDSPLVFAGIAKNEVGFFVAKKFLFNRLNEIYEFYGPNSTRIGNYIVAVGSQIVFPSDLKEFRCLIQKYRGYLIQSQLAVDQALYNAAINIWLSKIVGCEILSYFSVECEYEAYDCENCTIF